MNPSNNFATTKKIPGEILLLFRRKRKFPQSLNQIHKFRKKKGTKTQESQTKRMLQLERALRHRDLSPAIPAHKNQSIPNKHQKIPKKFTKKTKFTKNSTKNKQRRAYESIDRSIGDEIGKELGDVWIDFGEGLGLR